MMVTRDKLAASRDALNAVQRDGIVRSSDLSRTNRDRLVRSGFLAEIIRGWLVVTNPAAPDGAGTSWYASFWSFVAQYLDSRFGDAYCLSAEASVLRHVGASLIPRQVIAVVRESISQTIRLCFDTSLYVYSTRDSFPQDRENKDGLWLMSLAAALCRVSPAFFGNYPTDAEIALRSLRDPSELLRVLLEGGNTVVAGRIAGAYLFLGEDRFSEQIAAGMGAAGYVIRLTNPFEGKAPLLVSGSRVASPHAARIRSLWAAMRVDVAAAFEAVRPTDADPTRYVAQVEERYAADAYNSLSIEGYRVSTDLIERVRRGDWDPALSEGDARQVDALAARGYYQVFQAVKRVVGQVVAEAPAADVVAREHQSWYREMFAPSVTAGILKPAQLAGYRNAAVYLRGSRYVPPPHEAVLNCMDALFDQLGAEADPAVRAVLGHFFFVYIHPYPDGNGRIARFLMNVMFASGGYPWTIIRQERRGEYLASLETASTQHDIVGFARFVREEMAAG